MPNYHHTSTESCRASSSAKSCMYKIVVSDCDRNLKRTFKDDSICNFKSLEEAVISRIPDFERSRWDYFYRDADGDKIDICNEKDFEVMTKQSIKMIFVKRTGRKSLISLDEEQDFCEQTDDEKYGIWM